MQGKAQLSLRGIRLEGGGRLDVRRDDGNEGDGREGDGSEGDGKE